MIGLPGHTPDPSGDRIRLSILASISHLRPRPFGKIGWVKITVCRAASFDGQRVRILPMIFETVDWKVEWGGGRRARNEDLGVHGMIGNTKRSASLASDHDGGQYPRAFGLHL